MPRGHQTRFVQRFKKLKIDLPVRFSAMREVYGLLGIDHVPSNFIVHGFSIPRIAGKKNPPKGVPPADDTVPCGAA